MSRVGERAPAAFLIILLMTVQFAVVESAEAHATLLPPSVRLPILFQRVPWQHSGWMTMPTPPGHITERWER